MYKVKKKKKFYVSFYGNFKYRCVFLENSSSLMTTQD